MNLSKTGFFKIGFLACTMLVACNSNVKEEKQAEERVQEVLKSDQEKIDSMQKALEAQMNATSEDSLVKSKYGE